MLRLNEGFNFQVEVENASISKKYLGSILRSLNSMASTLDLHSHKTSFLLVITYHQ